VQLQRGDRGGELGPDVGRHQVGQVARLGHEITLREERPSGRGRFARLLTLPSRSASWKGAFGVGAG
jgi:hypothetical protein